MLQNEQAENDDGHLASLVFQNLSDYLLERSENSPKRDSK